MSEIERLAQICAEAHDYPLHEDAIPIVRAILQAMREPSEGMINAAYKFEYPDGTSATYQAAWQAMIDHILNQDEGLGHHGPKDRDRA